MGLLLIDSSSRRIEFGYAVSDEIIIREVLKPEFNADCLSYLIRQTFNKNRIVPEEIEFVSLSNGPGSFTGLRIGSAIAKGICFVTGSKLIEIPTLDIIANKYIKAFSGSPEINSKRTISLIFSNIKTGEFYYSEYGSESGKLKRFTDYKTDLPENIFQSDCDFVIDEKISTKFNFNLKEKIIDISNLSNLDSLFELTKTHIEKNIFADFRTSEPFYMKDFIPNI